MIKSVLNFWINKLERKSFKKFYFRALFDSNIKNNL